MLPPMDTTDFRSDDTVDSSLWRELADGTAGVGVRVVVTLAAAALLSGGALVLAYVISSPYVPDDLLATLFLLAGLAFLAITGWVWSRSMRSRAIALPIVITMGLATLAVAGGVWVEESLGGDTEVAIGGIVLLAFAGALLVWLRAIRRFRVHRPMRNRQDGMLDIRCPTCDYRMVGLRESRCPECGTDYTLDELLGRQGFGLKLAGAPAAPTRPPALPPVPTMANTHNSDPSAASSPTMTQIAMPQ